MATDTLRIFDEEFTNVAGIKATDSSNNTKIYIRPQGTKTINSGGSGIDVTEYAAVDVATGTAGTPTASKGAVSNHAITVTPSVTNSAGFINGGTKTGTGVTVSASELVSGSETKTSNGTYDVTNLASLIVNVSSGLEPIATKSFGTMSVTNTSAADSGKTITVSGLEDYDVLIVEVSVDTKANNRHAATVGLIWVTASSNLNTKDGTSILPAKNNFRMSSTGTPYSKYNTTSYGIYPYSCSAISNNSMTISFYQRYSSTGTGTINGAYTCRVYGVSLYDLIGG